MAKGKGKNNIRDSAALGRDGLKNIKDIAFNRFNIFEQGHIFRNQEYLAATANEVDKKLLDLNITLTALDGYYGTETKDPNIISLKNRTYKSYMAYNIIKNNLTSIMMTGDAGFLYGMQAKLAEYRYNI